MSDKVVSHNSYNSGIYKTVEYDLALQFVDRGLWRTKNLAKAVGVDEDTMTKWKRTKKMQEAYSGAVMKFIGRRKDIELILGELDVETPPPTPNTLIQVNYQPIFSGESIHGLPASDGDTQNLQVKEEN